MRLIDADKLHYSRIRIAHSDGIVGGYNAVVMSAEIKDAPTVDAVPVCRCKDCKYSEPWYRDKYRCFLWAETGIGVFEDGFCSYGERKGGDE